MRWDWPKQRFLVTKTGKLGDCWRCAVAAVLQIPAGRVPHFVQNARNRRKDPFALTQEWLNQRGLWLIHVSAMAGIYFPRVWNAKVTTPPIIACGPTPRSKKLGQHHAVVMVDGNVVYDPHPSNAGLTAIVERYMIISTDLSKCA